ncbi:MAG TPA: hypothetical protein VG456_04525 [Candidatus Sulfopaludibacter sp.]|jgi:hypothetical protein|nr:hypothetical protein [Candidatus Sulfopaludibacter sp.]
MISPEDLEALDQAFAAVREFGGEVRTSQAGESWYCEMLAGLLESAADQYSHMRLGLRHSTGMLAWACRNLLELNIYTQYVLQSEANARRFATNRVADGIDTFDAFKSWLARNDASLVPVEVDATLEDLAVLRSQEDEPPQRLYSLKYLSAEVGLADEYAYMTKICGKLSQPGVFAVTADEAQLQVFQPALFRAGAGHGMEMYQAVKTRIEA